MEVAQPAGVTPASVEFAEVSAPNASRNTFAPRLTATGGLASLVAPRHPVDDAAIRALVVQRRSGIAVERIGSLLAKNQYLSADSGLVASLVTQQIEAAWAELIAAGKIRVDSVEVETGSDWSNTLVRYTNLSSQRQRAVRLGELDA